MSRQVLPPSPPLTAWALPPHPLHVAWGRHALGTSWWPSGGWCPCGWAPLSSHRGCPGLCVWCSQLLCKLTGFMAQLGSQRREFQPGMATVSCEMWVLCGPVPRTLVSAWLELLSPVGTWPSLAGGQVRLLAFENLLGLVHGKKWFLSRPPTLVSLTEALRARPCVQPSWLGLGACPHRVGGQLPLPSRSTGSLPLVGTTQAAGSVAPSGRWGSCSDHARPVEAGCCWGGPTLGQTGPSLCVWEAFAASQTEVSRPSICLGSRTPAVTPSVSLLRFLELSGDGVSGPQLP